MSINAQTTSRTSPLAGGVTIGLGVMVAMWVAWFLMHMPVTAPHFPPAIAGPVLLMVLVLGCVVGLRLVPPGQRAVIGGIAGLVAGLVNLLVIGSKLTESTGSGAVLVPSAPLVIAGWLGLCVVLGLLAGAVSMVVWKGEVAATPGSRWLARFAWVNAAAILPLLTLGGLVTTAKAGFAVPDWPGTYGSNMFMYPLAMMSEPRIFLEHTHRLFGAMVGLTTITLLFFALAFASRGWMKLVAAGLLVAVIVQGVMGGVWVQNKAIALVLAHATLGQMFFGAMVLFAVLLSPRWQKWAADDEAAGRLRVPRVMCLVLVGSLLVQLIFGTMIRHLGSPHALWSHVGFSIVPMILTTIAGATLMKNKADAAHGRSMWLVGHVPMIIAGVQFLLGFAALAAYLTDDTRKIAAPVAEALASAPAIDPVRLLVRTVHQANGALLMASAMVLAGWGLAHGLAGRASGR